MKSLFYVLIFFHLGFSAFSAEAATNSEMYVTVQANKPDLKYHEGEVADFSIFEVVGWENKLEIEAYFQDENTPLTVVDTGVFSVVQTPTLEYGPASVIFRVFEVDEETRYVLRVPKTTLLEEFSVDFNVRYNDFVPPELSMIPEENAVFIDDMPFFQVDYTDNLSGVDLNTFKAFIIDAQGTRIDVSNLFTMTPDFATIQFDELNRLPTGVIFLEVSVSDINENQATKTQRYEVEIPKPTTGYFTGVVQDNTGSPVEGATVSILSGGTLNVRTIVTTDAAGKYRMSVGQGGEVLLSATKSGWTSQSSWVTGTFGKDSAVATFTIKPLDSSVTFIDKILGGIGTNASGTVEFHVAPNSASNDIHLNITQARSGNELPGPLPILSEFTFMGTMGPSGTTFSPPGKLKIKNELNFPPNTPIVVGMFNKDTGVWEDSGSDGKVSADGQWVEYDMPHFSSWDANQPVVPPTDKQPDAKTDTSDTGGGGCQKKGCRIDVDKGNLGVDYSLPGVVRLGQEYKPVFTYWSQSARPVVFASASQFFRYLAFGDHPDLIHVELKLGKIFKEVFFKGKGSIPSGDTVYSYRMMMEARGVDDQYMPTGVYDFQINVGNDYKNSRFATALYFGAPPLTPLSSITPEPVSLKYNVGSRVTVLNSRNSAFGKGWTMQGLERITTSSDLRVIWEDGSGKTSLFTGIQTPPPLPSKVLKHRAKGSVVIPYGNMNVLTSRNVTAMIEKDSAIIVADCDANSVYAVAVNGSISNIAGTGRAGFSGDGGLAKDAQLSCPSSVFSSYDGGLLIADKGNNRIRKVSKSGLITTVAGNGSKSESLDGGKAVNSGIGEPTFVSEDKLHSIHFISGNRVRFVDPRGRLSTLVAPDNAYYKANLSEPSQILYDEKDNPIIVDTGNDRILKVFLQTGDVRVIAGNTEKRSLEKISFASNLDTKARLSRPVSFAEDKANQIHYILDDSGSIHVLAHDGRILPTAWKSKHKSLVLSRNIGMVGATQNEKSSHNISRYISPPGDYSTLLPTGFDGGWLRIAVDGTQSFFNQEGQLTSRKTLDGKEEFFAYDSKARLTTWTIPTGESYTFSYEFLTGRLKEVTDPIGRVTRFDVNSAGQLVEVKNPQNKSRIFTYDNRDLLTSETDEESKKHEYVYGTDGLLKKEIYPDGSIREFKPRAAIAQMDALPPGVGTPDNPADMPIFENVFGEEKSTGGRDWKYKTDKYGQVVESVDGLGRTTEIERDNSGHVTRTTNPNGGQARLSYDSRGFPTLISDEMGYTRRYQYHPYGKILKAWDELNRETSFEYDTQLNLKKVTDPLSKITLMEYFPKGLLKKVTDHEGKETSFTYNAAGLLETSTDALGNVTEYRYNSAGLIEESEDALDRITSYEYDGLNRLKKIIDPALGETSFVYSDVGNLLSITDPKSQTTTYTYNSRGWKISETDALGRTEYYSYDPDGLMISKTRRDGSVIQYSYDEVKQLTRIGAPDGETKFNYDANGNLTWISNKNSSINRRYNSNNTMSSENQNGFLIEYGYNPVGTKASVNASGNQIAYFYNGMNNLSSIKALINNQVYNWSREFDDMNRPKKDFLPNGVQVHRDYTELSQLKYINNYNSSSNLISGYTYTYDEVGKRDSRVEESAVFNAAGGPGSKSLGTQYLYDSLDRLSGVTNPQESFVYDEVGNRKFNTNTSYNAINQLIGDGWKYTFEYNLNGDMTKKTNILSGQESIFIWNSESQLVGVQIKSSGSITKEIFFTYDGLGRRIGKSVVDHTQSAGSYGRRFFYDGDMIVEERDHSSNPTAVYLNGPSIDDPILVARKEGSFVYTKDGLGSISELTKANGTPVQKYRYSAYGVTTQELHDNPSDKKLIENRYGYTGRELDEEVGLYYYRARYYDPELGRFLSQDPLLMRGGDVNFYRYVGNDPFNYSDPMGLWRWPQDIYDDAMDEARNSGLPGAHNGLQDGFRHCVASCMMTQENTNLISKFLGDANEVKGDIRNNQERGEKCMDLNNNEVGRNIGKNGGSCVRGCMDAATSGGLSTYKGGSTRGYWD